ncbi:MAG: hypothetical protein DLM68_06470 [Hyphomicrobiales bacterium]|nr:MAG: hypothetical protein DLM68_06470 [Hyphomicrobiales bacterium]
MAPSDVIPFTIASVAPPDYVSDRLKPGFGLKTKIYINTQGFNQLEAKTARLVREVEIIADAHARFWRLVV